MISRRAGKSFMLLMFLSSVISCAHTENGKTAYRFPWQHEPKDSIPGLKAPHERIEELKQLADGSATKDISAAELAKQIQQEQDPQVRLYIVRALATKSDQVASAVLHAGLEDPSDDVKIACVEAWGKRGGPEAVRELTTVLEAEANIDVRLAAAKALGSTKDKAGVNALGKLLVDSDPAMQRRAMESLKNVSGQDYGYDVEAWRQYAAGEKVTQETPSLAERVRRLF